MGKKKQKKIVVPLGPLLGRGFAVNGMHQTLDHLCRRRLVHRVSVDSGVRGFSLATGPNACLSSAKRTAAVPVTAHTANNPMTVTVKGESLKVTLMMRKMTRMMTKNQTKCCRGNSAECSKSMKPLLESTHPSRVTENPEINNGQLSQ